jgi:hypothetical protein
MFLDAHASRGRPCLTKPLCAGYTAADEALDADMDLAVDSEFNELLAASAAGADVPGAGLSGADDQQMRGGSGVQRAIEISQQRAKKRAAVEELWQQFARGQPIDAVEGDESVWHAERTLQAGQNFTLDAENLRTFQ